MSASRTALNDNMHIDVHDAAEVLHVCEELSVTELELRDAIREVGSRLGDVKRVLAEYAIHNVPDRVYDTMPAEEGGKVRERGTAS